MTFDIERFFREHPVFKRASLASQIANEHTLKNTLAHYAKRGRIIRIKRGLFASIPAGADPHTYPVNPFLICSHLANDAVVAYYTALNYFGAAYSTSYRYVYLTQEKCKPFTFQEISYQPSRYPTSLLQTQLTQFSVCTEDIKGLDVRVTSRERTLVDILDRPLLGGGWEEIWRSLAMLTVFNIDKVIEYTLMLDTKIIAAKVGFYLESRQDALRVTQTQLEKLVPYRPTSPVYMDTTDKKNNKLIARWNLLVPLSLLSQHWEESLGWEPNL